MFAEMWGCLMKTVYEGIFIFRHLFCHCFSWSWILSPKKDGKQRVCTLLLGCTSTQSIPARIKTRKTSLQNKHSHIPWELEGSWWMDAMTQTIRSATPVMILRQRRPIVMWVNLKQVVGNDYYMKTWKYLLRCTNIGYHFGFHDVNWFQLLSGSQKSRESFVLNNGATNLRHKIKNGGERET